MVFFKKIICSIVVLMCCMSVEAAGNKDLYTANIALVSNSSSSALTQRAWQQILPRLTGHSLTQLPGDLVNQSEFSLKRLIERFQYQTRQGERVFHVVFSEHHVKALLSKQHVPLWVGPRPTTLLWVMNVQGDGSVSLLTIDTPEIQSLIAFSQDRAYPLMFPLGDLSDEEPLASMSAALSPAALESLAKRYHVHRILVARLKPGSASEWSWWSDKCAQQYWQQAYQPDEEAALLAGLQAAINAEAECSRQAVKSVINSYSLTVLGVGSFKDSESLLHGLTQQHAAFQWRHEGLSSNAMHVTLLSSGSISTLRQALRHVKNLRPLTKSQAALVYVWGKVLPTQRRDWQQQYASKSSFSLPVKIDKQQQEELSPLESSGAAVASFAYHSEAGYRASSDDKKNSQVSVLSHTPLVANIAPLAKNDDSKPLVVSNDSSEWQTHVDSKKDLEGGSHE